jgi:predicted homoserine dehydrogenase-like protein
MSLSVKLAARAAAGNPVRIGVIGAGKFGSMFLSQAPRTPGLHVIGIADLDVSRARKSCARVGWPAERYAAASFQEAMRNETTCILDDAETLIAADGIDVIVEATGNPAAGIRHALMCCTHRRHIVMVNVEADVLAGPLLARRAAEAGILYSFAYCRLRRNLRRQGHEVSTDLPPVDARHGVGPLRFHGGTDRRR